MLRLSFIVKWNLVNFVFLVFFKALKPVDDVDLQSFTEPLQTTDVLQLPHDIGFRVTNTNIPSKTAATANFLRIPLPDFFTCRDQTSQTDANANKTTNNKHSDLSPFSISISNFNCSTPNAEQVSTTVWQNWSCTRHIWSF